MTKDVILRLRLSAPQKEQIRLAAKQAGCSMSDFTLRAAVKAAMERKIEPPPVPGQLTLSDGLALTERK